MAQFIISIILALFAGVGVVAILAYFTNKKEQQEYKKWLDKLDKELRERDVKINGKKGLILC